MKESVFLKPFKKMIKKNKNKNMQQPMKIEGSRFNLKGPQNGQNQVNMGQNMAKQQRQSYEQQPQYNQWQYQQEPQQYAGYSQIEYNQNLQEQIEKGYQIQSANMFGETNMITKNNNNEYYDDLRAIDVNNSPYEDIDSQLIRNRRKPVEQNQHKSRFNTESFQHIKENKEVNQVIGTAKTGMGKVGDFIVGDVQNVKPKRKEVIEVPDDYRVSISEDIFDNEYNVIDGIEKPKERKRTLRERLKPKRKLLRNEKNKEKEKQADREQTIAKNYQYIRKELDGYSPLYKLDFLDKIRVVRRFLDEKSGKTARKLARKQQEEQRKKIEAQSFLLRQIKEKLEPLVNKQVSMQKIEIRIPKGSENVLDEVMRQDYFAMFEIKKIRPNPNLKIYNLNVPVLLTFKLLGSKIDL